MPNLRPATAKGNEPLPDCIAYIPSNTFPESAPDGAILAAICFADLLGSRAHVSTFAVDIPPVRSPLGGYLINVEGMARAAEERSRTECERLRALIEASAKDKANVQVTNDLETIETVVKDSAC